MRSTEILDRALAIVAADDRAAALVLLHEIASVEPAGAAPGLPGPLADAVLAVALGELSEDHRQTVATYERSRANRAAIVGALDSVFAVEDLLAIGTAVDLRLRSLREQEPGRPALPGRAATLELSPPGVEGVQLGPGRYLELKLIPDRRSGKRYGPYLYLRWFADNRFRSRYIGKPPR